MKLTAGFEMVAARGVTPGEVPAAAAGGDAALAYLAATQALANPADVIAQLLKVSMCVCVCEWWGGMGVCVGGKGDLVEARTCWNSPSNSPSNKK